MRVAVYIRVSDQSQVDGYSLDAQERQCIDFCRLKDHLPVRVYREEGRSARYESIRKRPLFKQMMDDAADHQFDVVLVHTLDRFSRNMKVMLEAVATLEQHGVGLVSATEELDWSSAEGRLVARTLGSFSEFFSDMLAKHTKKGIDERARQGRHLGNLPFGYEACWIEEKGEKTLRCKPEHPGGIHVHDREGLAVSELFKKYGTGTTTLATLASHLNDEGYRTRNTKKLPNSQGELVAEPRLFTTASVRGILHNPFYTGKVRHQGNLYPGLHEPLVTEELFDQVQTAMRKNSGRSKTLQPSPEREYLLKGLIRCAYCMMPMWAQTYTSGRRYYREHKGSRGAGICVNQSGSISCHVPDDQMGLIMSAIMLPDSWMDRLLAKVQLEDEVERVAKERHKVENRLKRLGQVYLDDLVEYKEYKRQKRKLEDHLSSLVVPGLDAVQAAGELLEDLPHLWERADLSERRRMLMTMLEAVYVECKEEKMIVGIKPKPAFKPLFEIALTKNDSGVVLVKESEDEEGPKSGNPAEPSNTSIGPDNGEGHASGGLHDAKVPCSWWRRGRVELPVQKIPWSKYTTGLANIYILLQRLPIGVGIH